MTLFRMARVPALALALVTRCCFLWLAAHQVQAQGRALR